jgi:carbamoyltransferase
MTNNSKIIGFQSGHDVAYCVLENGIPIIHEELERFTREKEPFGDGLQMFFDIVEDVDDIKYFCYGNPGNRTGRLRDGSMDTNLESSKTMNSLIEKNNGKFYVISHHQSHAANAFFSSNYDEALIITIDGAGIDKTDWEDITSERDGTDEFSFPTSFTFWMGKGNKIRPLKRIHMYEITLGSPYKIFTRDLFGLSGGYPHGNQAGTVMAMACMGDSDKHWKEFYDSLKRGGGGPSVYNMNLAKKYRDLIESETDEKKKETLKFDVAAGIQRAVETISREYITPYIEEYKPKNVCMAGGVALNSVIVGKMYDWYPNVENIYVCPVPYDAGLAIGSAQYVYHQVMGNPRINWKDNASPYLGRTYDEESIWDEIKKQEEKISFEVVDDNHIVDLLIEQNIVSVFGGGSESGRRALGNRSILCDPRSPDMKDIINEKVKHRQWFRPFAPSITREDVKDWFVKDVDSPYMTSVIKFKEEVRHKVPAVVHFDGSARLQTVTKNDNEWYYGFIKKFQEKTEVPILLNTSFNDREPIVETPEHAINCYMGTNIDYLYFFEYGILVSKK